MTDLEVKFEVSCIWKHSSQNPKMKLFEMNITIKLSHSIKKRKIMDMPEL